MKTKIISILALLLTMTQGAWAQEKTYTQYTATAGTGGAYVDQDYTKLVDNIDNVEGNKWCAPFGEGGLYIEFNTPSAIIPTGYTMITGGDTHKFSNRNPKSWVLKGKLNASDEWLILATVTDDSTLPASSLTATSFTITNAKSAAFKYFRFEVSAVHSEITSETTAKFQLAEMRLKGTDASFPTYTPTSGTTTGTLDLGNYGCLFDGQIAKENKWCIAFNGSLYVEFNTAAPIIPAGYTLNTGGDTEKYPNRNPKSWTLKGKLNPSDAWTTIDTKADDTSMPATNLTPVNFDISNTKPYKYFRFEVSAVHNEITTTSDGTTAKFQLAEMSLTGSNAASYTVTYNGNGSTSGSVPTGGSHWQNSTVTVASAGDLSKTGYTFAGWLNSVDGNTYAADQSFTITSNTTLTAQWTANTYSVHFNGNGSTSGSMDDESFTYDEAKTLTPNTFSRTGYTFDGWATTADGDVAYTDGQSVSNLTAENGATVELFAHWSSNTTTSGIDWDPSTNSGTFLMPAYNVEVSTELWYKVNEEKTLAENIEAYGEKSDFFLNRTLTAGVWNTFASPFAIAAGDMEKYFGADAKVRQLESTSVDGTVLTLNFTDATSIETGQPYLVKPAVNVDFSADGKEFENVNLSSASATATTTTYVDFVPTLGKTLVEGDVKNILILNTSGTLVHPSAVGNMKGFRGYFLMHDAPAGAREFIINFDYGETTGIQPIRMENGTTPAEGTYDLSGRRIQGQPTQKGIYIQNGKKVVIK